VEFTGIASLGVGFKSNDENDGVGVCLSTIVAGGAADALGEMASGDWLVSINDVDVSKHGKKGVILAMKAAMGKPLKMVLTRERGEASPSLSPKAGGGGGGGGNDEDDGSGEVSEVEVGAALLRKLAAGGGMDWASASRGGRLGDWGLRIGPGAQDGSSSSSSASWPRGLKSTAWTVEMWARPSMAALGAMQTMPLLVGVLGGMAAGGGHLLWQLHIEATGGGKGGGGVEAVAVFRIPGARWEVRSDDPITFDGGWQHFAVTFDSRCTPPAVKLMVGGTVAASNTTVDAAVVDRAMTEATAAVTAGAGASAGSAGAAGAAGEGMGAGAAAGASGEKHSMVVGPHFIGDIFEVRVWRVARSEIDIEGATHDYLSLAERLEKFPVIRIRNDKMSKNRSSSMSEEKGGGAGEGRGGGDGGDGDGEGGDGDANRRGGEEKSGRADGLGASGGNRGGEGGAIGGGVLHGAGGARGGGNGAGGDDGFADFGSSPRLSAVTEDPFDAEDGEDGEEGEEGEDGGPSALPSSFSPRQGGMAASPRRATVAHTASPIASPVGGGDSGGRRVRAQTSGVTEFAGARAGGGVGGPKAGATRRRRQSAGGLGGGLKGLTAAAPVGAARRRRGPTVSKGAAKDGKDAE
jgi:hypothetical protein